MSTREVRHKTRKLEKSDINQEELIKLQQMEANDKATAFTNGSYWTQNNKMSAKGAMKFNNLMYSAAKNGEFKSGLSKKEALAIFNKRDKNIKSEVSKGNFPKEKQEKICEEIGWKYKGKEKTKEPPPPANATQNEPPPPANATPKESEQEQPKQLTEKQKRVRKAIKEKAPELEQKGKELKGAQERLKKTAEFHKDDVTEDFERMKAKLAQYEHDELTIKEMAEKLDERADIPPEAQNNEPEDKPVDDIAPPPESKLSLDEKQRKIADTFPNTKALQTGCYETVRNTDYSRVTFNPKSLRPEYNYTKGITSKINVIQKVNVGNLNKYVLR